MFGYTSEMGESLPVGGSRAGRQVRSGPKADLIQRPSAVQLRGIEEGS